MRRREFITLIGGAGTWPLVARAQQPERTRRIGVLMPYPDKDNPEAQARIRAFLQELQQLGWTTDRNLQIEYRWTSGDTDSSRKAAMELAALPLDLIFATSTPSVVALQQATRTLPIVFVMVADPVAAGFVASMAKPGGNMTGFPIFEYGVHKMAGAAQRNCSPHCAYRRRSRPNGTFKCWPVRRHPVCGALVWGGIDPAGWARHQRRRADDHRIRTRIELRADLRCGSADH